MLFVNPFVCVCVWRILAYTYMIFNNSIEFFVLESRFTNPKCVKSFHHFKIAHNCILAWIVAGIHRVWFRVYVFYVLCILCIVLILYKASCNGNFDKYTHYTRRQERQKSITIENTFIDFHFVLSLSLYLSFTLPLFSAIHPQFILVEAENVESVIKI